MTKHVIIAYHHNVNLSGRTLLIIQKKTLNSIYWLFRKAPYFQHLQQACALNIISTRSNQHMRRINDFDGIIDVCVGSSLMNHFSRIIKQIISIIKIKIIRIIDVCVSSFQQVVKIIQIKNCELRQHFSTTIINNHCYDLSHRFYSRPIL